MALPVLYNYDDFAWGANTTAFLAMYTVDVAAGGMTPNKGRGTPQGMALHGGASSGYIGWTLRNLETGATFTSSRVGQFFGHNANGGGPGMMPGLRICDFCESQGGVVHIQLQFDNLNQVIVRRGDGGTILGVSDGTVANSGVGTTAFVMPASAFDGSGPTEVFEAIVTVDDTTGSVVVKVDDVLIFNLQNVNTHNGGVAAIGYVALWYSGRYSSEWAVHDGSGWLGEDKRILTVPAASAGAYTAGTAVGAATLVDCVDDVYPETEGANYVSMDDTGLPKKVNFGLAVFPTNTEQIVAVMPHLIAKKSDGGTNTGKVFLVSGATEATDASPRAIPDAYVSHRRIHQTDPNTTAEWTVPNAQASKPGFERVT